MNLPQNNVRVHEYVDTVEKERASLASRERQPLEKKHSTFLPPLPLSPLPSHPTYTGMASLVPPEFAPSDFCCDYSSPLSSDHLADYLETETQVLDELLHVQGRNGEASEREVLLVERVGRALR